MEQILLQQEERLNRQNLIQRYCYRKWPFSNLTHMNLKAIFLLCGKMMKLEKCSSKSNDIGFDFSLKFAHLAFGVTTSIGGRGLQSPQLVKCSIHSGKFFSKTLRVKLLSKSHLTALTACEASFNLFSTVY